MLEVRRIHRSCNRHMPRLRISGIHANGNAVFFGKTGGNEKVAEPLAGSQYRPSAAMAEGRFCMGGCEIGRARYFAKFGLGSMTSARILSRRRLRKRNCRQSGRLPLSVWVSSPGRFLKLSPCKKCDECCLLLCTEKLRTMS